MKLSVIIPSRTAQNFLACAGAVHQHEPGVRLILVDDGVGPFAWHSIDPFEAVPGEKPFVFARNVNIGIRAAGADDVVLLNDDALLQTPLGFSLLQSAAIEHPEYGVIAAACNNVGNPNQNYRGQGLRADPRMVCFTAVLLPRRTIDQVGLLDERFTGYGMDDDDYCLRVRQAGLKIGIHDGCFVDHSRLVSSFRGHGCGDYRPNLEIYKRKWGVDNWGRPA